MLTLTPAQFTALRRATCSFVAEHVARLRPDLGSADTMFRYVDEALAAGVTSADDIATLCVVLGDADKIGRTADLQARLDDPAVNGSLKLAQILFAWKKVAR